MKILVFEWMIGGGLLFAGQSLERAKPIWRQGLAMAQAIAADFLSAGCEVLMPIDFRLSAETIPGRRVEIKGEEQLPQRLRELAADSDGVFLIAPETGGRLAEVVGWVEQASGKLLSPSRNWVELCSDKHRCQEYLAAAGVTVPPGLLWRVGGNTWPPPVTLPAVIKPNDGCGGEDVREVGTSWGTEPSTGTWRIESRVPGQPLSVLALVGPAGHLMLQPTVQCFAGGRLGDYVGGELVTDPVVIRLARSTAAQVLAALPGMYGMFGIDLVVDRSGETATVIEVNPRLTCSYLGLRQVYDDNLAASLLGLFQTGFRPVNQLLPARLEHKWLVPD